MSFPLRTRSACAPGAADGSSVYATGVRVRHVQSVRRVSPAHGHVPPLRGQSTPNFAGRKPTWPTGARSGLLRYRTSARRFERGAFSIRSRLMVDRKAGILQVPSKYMESRSLPPTLDHGCSKGSPHMSVERSLPTTTWLLPVCERTKASTLVSKAAARAGCMRSRENPLREWNEVTYAANGC